MTCPRRGQHMTLLAAVIVLATSTPRRTPEVVSH